MTVDLGKNWKLVPISSCEDALVATVLDEKSGKYLWVCLDPSTGKHVTLAARYGPILSPVFDLGRKEIVFADRGGITSFSIPTKQDQLMIPFDWENWEVHDLWLSPEEPPTILYLLGKRKEPWSIVVDKVRNSSCGVPLKSTFSLHSWKIGGIVSRLLTQFELQPVSLDVDWQRETLFALVGPTRNKKLTRIDLRSSQLSLIRTTVGLSGVVVSPRHNPVTWGSHDGKITESLANGQDITLTDFGWYPAFSLDGKRFAFTVSDYQIWVKDAARKLPEKVVAIAEEMTQHRCDTPTWCRCGKHFAVCLAGPTSMRRIARIIVVADCEKREIVIFDQFSATAEARLWLPRSLVTEC